MSQRHNHLPDLIDAELRTNGREPAPADAPKTRSRAPPETGGGGAIAGKLLGLLAAGLTDGAGDPALSARVAAFRPTPYPSETRDCRSEAILRPVSNPRFVILLRAHHLRDSGIRFPLFDSR